MKETKESIAFRLCTLAKRLYEQEDFENLDILWGIINPFFHPIHNPEYSEEVELFCELTEKLVAFRHFARPPMPTDDILFEMEEILKNKGL